MSLHPMYRKAIASFLLLTAASISYAGYVTSDEIEKGIKKCQGTPNSFDCANEVEFKLLKEKPPGIKRSPKKLTFKTDAKDVSFEDRVTGYASDSVYYKYVGFNKPLQSHLVFVQSYEGARYILLNQSTGNQVIVYNYPEASVDGKHFISYDDGVYNEHGVPWLGVWDMEGNEAKQVARFDLNWSLKDVHWITGDTFEVRQPCAKAKPSCKTTQITLKNNKWNVVD